MATIVVDDLKYSLDARQVQPLSLFFGLISGEDVDRTR